MWTTHTQQAEADAFNWVVEKMQPKHKQQTSVAVRKYLRQSHGRSAGKVGSPRFQQLQLGEARPPAFFVNGPAYTFQILSWRQPAKSLINKPAAHHTRP